MVEFRITTPIADDFPELFVNIIIVRGMDNTANGSLHDRISAFARSSEARLRRQFCSRSDLRADPRVGAYLEMFKKFGSNPKRMRPSHFALCDRVVAGGVLPNINPAVNLYNAFSVRYIVPFGGEDLDKVDDFFELAYATGDEPWTPIGSEGPHSTRNGDVVWRDRSEVSTTSLNYRQCDKTKLTSTTTNAYFLSEGFRGINDDDIERMSSEFTDVFQEFLGGDYQRFTIDSAIPTKGV
jgi:DNA/RNA-binding domain of Phe-tRNA-synthetase-like protein